MAQVLFFSGFYKIGIKLLFLSGFYKVGIKVSQAAFFLAVLRINLFQDHTG